PTTDTATRGTFAPRRPDGRPKPVRPRPRRPHRPRRPRRDGPGRISYCRAAPGTAAPRVCWGDARQSESPARRGRPHADEAVQEGVRQRAAEGPDPAGGHLREAERRAAAEEELTIPPPGRPRGVGPSGGGAGGPAGAP